MQLMVASDCLNLEWTFFRVRIDLLLLGSYFIWLLVNTPWYLLLLPACLRACVESSFQVRLIFLFVASRHHLHSFIWSSVFHPSRCCHCQLTRSATSSILPLLLHSQILIIYNTSVLLFSRRRRFRRPHLLSIPPSPISGRFARVALTCRVLDCRTVSCRTLSRVVLSFLVLYWFIGVPLCCNHDLFCRVLPWSYCLICLVLSCLVLLALPCRFAVLSCKLVCPRAVLCMLALPCTSLSLLGLSCRPALCRTDLFYPILCCLLCRVSLSCFVISCIVLRCLDLPCPIVHCLALPCPALLCRASLYTI